MKHRTRMGCWAGLAILALWAWTDTAQAQRIDGFRSLNDRPYGWRLVDDHSRAGRYSQRFEVRAGDCAVIKQWNDCATDRERSEITVRSHWRHGDNVWIGWSFRLPPDFQTSDRVRTTIAQIHQRGGPRGQAGGFPSLPPIMQLELQGDRFFLRVQILTGSRQAVTNTVEEFDLGRVRDLRDRWTDVMINFDTGGKGQLLAVYVDSLPRAEIRDWIMFPGQEYYFKYGIYRSFVSRHGSPMPTQILWVDEIRIGRDSGAVAIDAKKPLD